MAVPLALQGLIAAVCRAVAGIEGIAPLPQGVEQGEEMGWVSFFLAKVDKKESGRRGRGSND